VPIEPQRSPFGHNASIIRDSLGPNLFKIAHFDLGQKQALVGVPSDRNPSIAKMNGTETMQVRWQIGCIGRGEDGDAGIFRKDAAAERMRGTRSAAWPPVSTLLLRKPKKTIC
jgi:hypothetical protein